MFVFCCCFFYDPFCINKYFQKQRFLIINSKSFVIDFFPREFYIQKNNLKIIFMFMNLDNYVRKILPLFCFFTPTSRICMFFRFIFLFFFKNINKLNTIQKHKHPTMNEMENQNEDMQMKVFVTSLGPPTGDNYLYADDTVLILQHCWYDFTFLRANLFFSLGIWKTSGTESFIIYRNINSTSISLCLTCNCWTTPHI